jgi:hypothetical protein
MTLYPDGLYNQFRKIPAVMKPEGLSMEAEDRSPGAYYQIVVKGQLEPHWSQWFNGMDIQNLPTGEAVISGLIVDQAMLHGILNKIRDLGLPLVSLRCPKTEKRLKKK